MHEGLVRFYPTLGSKGLALAITEAQRSTCNLQPATCNSPSDLILIDGELTSGSTLLFYTRQPAHFVNGRVNGTWYGSFWPDAPAVFDDNASLDRLWAGPAASSSSPTPPPPAPRASAPSAPSAPSPPPAENPSSPTANYSGQCSVFSGQSGTTKRNHRAA